MRVHVCVCVSILGGGAMFDNAYCVFVVSFELEYETYMPRVHLRKGALRPHYYYYCYWLVLCVLAKAGTPTPKGLGGGGGVRKLGQGFFKMCCDQLELILCKDQQVLNIRDTLTGLVVCGHAFC